MWHQKNGDWARPPDDFQVYDAGTDYLVHIMNTREFPPGETLPIYYIEVPDQVRLWYEWAS